MRNNIKIKASICNWIRDDVCCSLLLKREIGCRVIQMSQKINAIKCQMNDSKIYSKHDIAAPTARCSTIRRQLKKKKQQCVKYTRIPLFRNAHHRFTSKHTLDSLQQKYSSNDTISNHNHLQQCRGGRGNKNKTVH